MHTNFEGANAIYRRPGYIKKIAGRHDLAWLAKNNYARSQINSDPKLFDLTAEELGHEHLRRCEAAYRDAVVLEEYVQSALKVGCEAVVPASKATTTGKESLFFEVLDNRAIVKERAEFDDMVLDRESYDIYRLSTNRFRIFVIGRSSSRTGRPGGLWNCR